MAVPPESIDMTAVHPMNDKDVTMITVESPMLAPSPPAAVNQRNAPPANQGYGAAPPPKTTYGPTSLNNGYPSRNNNHNGSQNKQRIEVSMPPREEPTGVSKCMAGFLSGFFMFLIAVTFPLTLWFCIRIVKEYERAVLFRLGRAHPGAKGPGLFFIIPCIDQLVNMDLRTISFDVPPQEILTKDSVTIAVDAVVYFKVNNPYVAVCNVENASGSTRLLAQTTLRNFLGTKSLSEILSEREEISAMMQNYLDEGTDPWGVRVERVEMLWRYNKPKSLDVVRSVVILRLLCMGFYNPSSNMSIV